jgi:hypothetical protein
MRPAGLLLTLYLGVLAGAGAQAAPGAAAEPLRARVAALAAGERVEIAG